MKSEPLTAALSAYENGRKCASAVDLSTVDLSTLKAGALKQLVKDKGIECTGCSEKAEFVAQIKAWLAANRRQV